ncbi:MULTISPECIES: LysM peptidoglycan-binding domain-containing protein [Bacteria]|uniref:LysM peptidoglycan-binding domain-containing protein n=1 Tax=Bacteria TaxID=2 RepID=UPI003C7CEF9F
MSSITLAPAFSDSVPRSRAGAAVLPAETAAAGLSASSAPKTRLRITARGRRVLAGLVALPVAGAIAFAVLGGGTALASGTQTSGASFQTVTVMPGDSLWSIATEIAPDADPRDVVDAIARLNLIRSGTLEIGQKISIPAQYSSAR